MKTIIPTACVSSSFGVCENLNKQLLSVIPEMILSDERNLEALVCEENAKAVAELEEAVRDVQEAEVSPLIEQQLDPESFESTSYSIDLPGYSSSSYDAGKYYDLVQGENGETSATVTGSTDYQHEFLQEAQDMVSQIKQGDNTKNPFVEAQIDTNIKYLKESVKMVFSEAIWKLMYEGKLTFN